MNIWNNHRLTLFCRPTTEADKQDLLALLPEGEITDLDQLPQTLPGHSISLTPEIKFNGEITISLHPAIQMVVSNLIKEFLYDGEIPVC